MKKILAFILTLAIVFSMTACNGITIVFGDKNNNSDNSDSSDNNIDFTSPQSVKKTVKRQNGTSVPVTVLSQYAVKNDDFLDSEVSWYDDEYNYYVFNVGTIKNVPLTSTYDAFYYNGATSTYSRTVTKLTEESVEFNTSKAVNTSVTNTKETTINITSGVSASMYGIEASIETSYGKALTNSQTAGQTWTKTYQECVTQSLAQEDTLTITFDSSCDVGYYLYLMLANVDVYYAVIQPRTNPSKYYVETYNSIVATKYVLNYTGESDDFAINKKEKIDIDTSFIADLKQPTKYIKSEIEEPEIEIPVVTFEPYVKTHYIDGSYVVSGTKYWYFHPYDANIIEYYNRGYNKIEISYSFNADGSWSVFGGYIDADCYIGHNKNTDQSLYYKCEPTGKNIKMTGSTKTDLKWFVNEGEVYLICKCTNLTETYTISNVSITIKITKE